MKKIVSLSLVILWMSFIFYMSSLDSTISSHQSSSIVDILLKVFPTISENVVSIIIRKTAHFLEYFILGLLVYNYLRQTKCEKIVLVAILVCILYAITDEVHQAFVPGRSCRLLDMGIDSLGSIFGIYLLNFKNKTKCDNICM